MPEVRLIDANAFSEQYGNYYAEEGPAEGFIGTVGELIAKQPTEDLFRKILVEVDYYYSTRKQMCYPIGYLDMLIYAVHCAVNGIHEEALYAIERVRKAREGA